MKYFISALSLLAFSVPLTLWAFTAWTPPNQSAGFTWIIIFIAIWVVSLAILADDII